jgi:hypothetical protein
MDNNSLGDNVNGENSLSEIQLSSIFVEKKVRHFTNQII